MLLLPLLYHLRMYFDIHSKVIDLGPRWRTGKKRGPSSIVRETRQTTSIWKTHYIFPYVNLPPYPISWLMENPVQNSKKGLKWLLRKIPLWYKTNLAKWPDFLPSSTFPGLLTLSPCKCNKSEEGGGIPIHLPNIKASHTSLKPPIK